MKKLLLILAFLGSTAFAWAEHIFSICYYNQTTAPVSYNNNGLSHKWKNRGEMTGNGQLAPGESKCFGNIVDETMFTSDYISFSIDRKWVGIVNAAFSRPYIISQDGVAKKGGLCTDKTKDGHDNYELHIFVTPNGLIYSNSSDPKDTDSIIQPRKFK